MSPLDRTLDLLAKSRAQLRSNMSSSSPSTVTNWKVAVKPNTNKAKGIEKGSTSVPKARGNKVKSSLVKKQRSGKELKKKAIGNMKTITTPKMVLDSDAEVEEPEDEGQVFSSESEMGDEAIRQQYCKTKNLRFVRPGYFVELCTRRRQNIQHLYKIFGDSKDCKQDRSGEVGPRALSMASIYNLWLRPIRQCPLSNTEEPHWLHGLIERNDMKNKRLKTIHDKIISDTTDDILELLELKVQLKRIILSEKKTQTEVTKKRKELLELQQHQRSLHGRILDMKKMKESATNDNANEEEIEEFLNSLGNLYKEDASSVSSGGN
ncbi:hypothetical protein BSL78_10531 [Apostichopus japonicus]|uniref:Uncharacterized protein n=1 Tax=Stichopus japonicus TaxID=307972 RepID=A0A2G8KX66_STIJA|nr:hypothetical protein BSL78_10531 [Apostichopus japonicus]